MSDIARCPKCLQHFDNTIAVLTCPKCGANIDGSNLQNETFANTAVNVSKEEIAQINTYLGLSIISIFFCFPLGLAALIFSVLTLNDKNKGDYSAAISHSALARNLLLASIIIGGIILGLNSLGKLNVR